MLISHSPSVLGIVQLDAAIMDGNGCQFGAVAALEGIATPILVAHKVMTESPHSVLAGDGAAAFAQNHGFTIEENSKLLPKPNAKVTGGEGSDDVSDSVGHTKEPPGRNAVEMTECNTFQTPSSSHDTLSVIAMDGAGNIVAGLSSSGAPGKHPGRIGDGPLPGSGLYADNNTGAACVTGDGDVMLRFCPSFLATEMMHQGVTPQKACEQVVNRVCQKLGTTDIEMGIIAMDMKGEVGASGAVKSWTDVRTKETYSGFPYSYSKCNGDGSLSAQIHVAPCIV